MVDGAVSLLFPLTSKLLELWSDLVALCDLVLILLSSSSSSSSWSFSSLKFSSFNGCRPSSIYKNKKLASYYLSEKSEIVFIPFLKHPWIQSKRLILTKCPRLVSFKGLFFSSSPSLSPSPPSYPFHWFSSFGPSSSLWSSKEASFSSFKLATEFGVVGFRFSGWTSDRGFSPYLSSEWLSDSREN